RALRGQLRARLEEVMPFSSEHVLCAHSPHEEDGVEGVDAAADLPNPARPLPVWRCQTPPLLGVTGIPYQVGLKRLTLASAQVLPGLGLEGEFAIGWCAARLASGGAKKKDFLKDEVIAGSR